MSAPSNVRRAVIKRDGHRCKKCVRGVAEGVSLHVHHIIAEMDGGKHEPDNLITLCTICHHEWHEVAELTTTMTFAEWIETPTYMELVALLWAFKHQFPDYYSVAMGGLDARRAYRKGELFK